MHCPLICIHLNKLYLTINKVVTSVHSAVRTTNTSARQCAPDAAEFHNPMYSSYQEISLEPVSCNEVEIKDENSYLSNNTRGAIPPDNEKNSPQMHLCCILLCGFTLLLLIISLVAVCLACLLWFGVVPHSNITLPTTTFPTPSTCSCPGLLVSLIMHTLLYVFLSLTQVQTCKCSSW